MEKKKKEVLAVSYLYEEIDRAVCNFLDGYLTRIELSVEITHAKNKALQMEREQIETAYQAGDGDAYNLKETKTWAEQYYKQTYGGQDE